MGIHPDYDIPFRRLNADVQSGWSNSSRIFEEPNPRVLLTELTNDVPCSIIALTIDNEQFEPILWIVAPDNRV